MSTQRDDGRANGYSLPLNISEVIRLLDSAVIATTLDGTVTVWNPAASRMVQYGADEMIRSSISKIIPADQPDELEFISTRVMAGENIKGYETAWIRKDGRSVDVSLRASAVRDGTGRVGGILWLGTDITERNRLQRAERDQSFSRLSLPQPRMQLSVRTWTASLRRGMRPPRECSATWLMRSLENRSRF